MLVDRDSPLGAAEGQALEPGISEMIQGNEEALQGLRVLVVEDAFSMAMVLEAALTAAGCSVVGPAARLDKAWPLMDQDFDGAILDVNLEGEDTYPLATKLRERGVPFILSTGYEVASLHPDFRDAPHIEKPFDVDALMTLMARVFRPQQV